MQGFPEPVGLARGPFFIVSLVPFFLSNVAASKCIITQATLGQQCLGQAHPSEAVMAKATQPWAEECSPGALCWGLKHSSATHSRSNLGRVT